MVRRAEQAAEARQCARGPGRGRGRAWAGGVADLLLEQLTTGHGGLRGSAPNRPGEHYGGILAERARTGRNGARWQIDTVTSLELRGASRPEALAEMTRLYRAAVDTGEPVHAWPVPARQRS